ncbi:non-ribosomal peptide synthetase [Actinoplanes sp. N902-109]|uniref:non-ribosomal peptide synthetase n=1 Tax=Actinoplanes sp. (strain N902-109) TaxID=649831 RepID=UPI0012F719EF|nr:non-ribosomal peptide synthetase [Actinoplanes sp. N902-109]
MQPTEGFRLSVQQERIAGLISAGATGRTVAGVRLTGPAVDLETLEHAAQDVVSAHESLRTAYRRVLGANSSMLMVIDDEPRVTVTESGGDLATIVHEKSVTDAYENGIDLTVHTDGGRRSLLLSAPRLSMDDTSAGVFFRDLQQAYAERLNGKSWTRDDVVQYADFAQWQLEEAAPTEAEKKAAAEERARLMALAPLRLPLELRSDSTERAVLEWTVPAPLAHSLREFGRDLEHGLRSVLLTGWLAALWHATGRPEAFAADVRLPGRPFDELTASVGSFETHTPIFAAFDDKTTVSSLLADLDQSLTAAGTESGLAGLPQQHVAVLPGFTFTDVVQYPADSAMVYEDLWVESPDLIHKVALVARATGEGIHLTLSYQAQGMADGGAEALLTCLRAAVHAIAGDASTPVAEWAMLDEDAARALIEAVNAQHTPDVRPAHWHRQLEQTAQRCPDATALKAATRFWSYRELDESANRLAHELRARGVSRGDLVGLCLERSDLAIVAMVAIAKAGAGYVPVDPQLPSKRRATIADAAGLRHVVATDANGLELPADCDVVLLDAELTVCAGRSSERPDVETADDDVAYVLFTSGSTGTPKGVLVGYGQLAAYLGGVVERLGLTGAIDSVGLSTLGTDLGNTALFPPLMTGGSLRIVGAADSGDAQVLADLLTEETFDLIKITPSHLEAVISVAGEPARLMPRQALVLGGQATGWGSYGLLQPLLGEGRLFNHYGPSETTVGVLCGEITDNRLAGLTSTLPLGRPMRHARCYVLDSNRRPLPVGVPGDLWIGGASVSQGYLAGTANSDESFVEDPFSTVPGARMYRSGDRARLLPDRTFEFLGRGDRQIKVRGFRVEIGEIEAVMRQHPRVMESLVVFTGESMTARLVAYLTDAERTRGSAEWLRGHLAERLPEYMVPTHFVALDAFPLTSTGKIDASMLPEPGTYDAGSTSTVEPRTATERKVAEVWIQLLLLKSVGADDDFFEIGGHSLLATQLVAKLRLEFKVNLKLRHLFERPVLSELAEYIDQLLEEKAEAK